MIISDQDGLEYWENKKLHRIIGPAVKDSDGTEYWYENGELHRDGGFAIIESNSKRKEWYTHGELIRMVDLTTRTPLFIRAMGFGLG